MILENDFLKGEHVASCEMDSLLTNILTNLIIQPTANSQYLQPMSSVAPVTRRCEGHGPKNQDSHV